jgi:predicted DCC family thiol-disulfide oxidoreductase YuxK
MQPTHAVTATTTTLLRRCGRAPDDISSIVLVEEGAHYIKSDAILRIATRLALPLPVVAAALMPLPYFIKDTFYDQVRHDRGWWFCIAC